MITFEHWKSEELELAFGLKRVYEHPSLLTWLAAKHPPSDTEEALLRQWQAQMKRSAEYWNEDETKFFFISPLITLINYNSEHFTAFTQRPMAATVKNLKGEDVLLKGRVEFVVATGRQDPRQPFFFLHEYKQERKRDNDPLGQVLSAMLAARQINDTKHPLYGCYVVGRFWFFLILDGNDYSVSDAYVASQDDIFDIYSILKQAKIYIQQRFETAAL
jgi:hypothetical protein